MDKKQLDMGIQSEAEEHPWMNSADVERLAKDHLKEIPDYYTRLEKMEKQGGEVEGEDDPGGKEPPEGTKGYTKERTKKAY